MTCRRTAEEADPGVLRMGVLPFAGVEGDCIGLASGRLAGVVDEGRLPGDGEIAAVRPRGLRTGIDD